MTEAPASMSWGAFVPIALLTVALLSQAVFQQRQLTREHAMLEAQFAQQTQPLEEAKKLRTQLEALAGDTAILADQGNANAVRLRDYLRQQGITIRSPQPQTAPAAAAATE